jgi:hypothetical protein
MGREGSQGRMGWLGEAVAWSVADMLSREIRGGGIGACGVGESELPLLVCHFEETFDNKLI